MKDKVEHLAYKLDLPAEALTGAAKLTVTGRRQALIENHRGIINYDENTVTVSCEGYRLSIRGDDMRLEGMNDNDMLLTGRILSVEFE